MGNEQKERTGLITPDEVNGSVRDNVGGIAFLVLDLRSIHPIAMLVVVAATGEEADKLIKAMVDRIVPLPPLGRRRIRWVSSLQFSFTEQLHHRLA
jgi:hypothetical protein